MIGFGIDLAGYTTGKTALAVAEITGQLVKATLLLGSALSTKRDSGTALQDVVAGDVNVLQRCLSVGSVAVDIPIDLQGLPNPTKPQKVWELTRRPIDRAINAMPPFADRIGAPVARFAAIMRHGNFGHLVGQTLFEAYPAGTLKILKIKANKYKGKSGAENLVALCDELRVKPHVKNDDHIDAIICAITAATPDEQIHEAKSLGIEGRLPLGFRIPKSLSFDGIVVDEADFDDWMTKRKSQRVA
jgi:hypothetical protein